MADTQASAIERLARSHVPYLSDKGSAPSFSASRETLPRPPFSRSQGHLGQRVSPPPCSIAFTRSGNLGATIMARDPTGYTILLRSIGPDSKGNDDAHAMQNIAFSLLCVLQAVSILAPRFVLHVVIRHSDRTKTRLQRQFRRGSVWKTRNCDAGCLQVRAWPASMDTRPAKIIFCGRRKSGPEHHPTAPRLPTSSAAFAHEATHDPFHHVMQPSHLQVGPTSHWASTLWRHVGRRAGHPSIFSGTVLHIQRRIAKRDPQKRTDSTPEKKCPLRSSGGQSECRQKQIANACNVHREAPR